MNLRTLVCTAAGILAVCCILLAAPTDAFAPKGIVLPAKTVRAKSNPADITIYNQAPSGNYQTLGQVRVEFAFRHFTPLVQERLAEKIKSLASEVGANGVIVNVLTPGEDLQQRIIFIGTAIYIGNQ